MAEVPLEKGMSRSDRGLILCLIKSALLLSNGINFESLKMMK